MRKITQHERDAAYEEFRQRVLAIETAQDAISVILAMPAPDTPGRLFYTSFRSFWESMRRPGGASDLEWALYRGLTEKLVANGVLKPSALDTFKESK